MRDTAASDVSTVPPWVSVGSADADVSKRRTAPGTDHATITLRIRLLGDEHRAGGNVPAMSWFTAKSYQRVSPFLAEHDTMLETAISRATELDSERHPFWAASRLKV